MTAINPLEELFRDPEVSEIMVDAPDSVRVERQGRIELADVQFLDERHVQRTIERIVDPDDRGCNRRGQQYYACSLLRKETPFDGCRVSAIRDDTDGHWKLNISKRGEDVPVDMLRERIDCGCLVEGMADYYRSLVLARMGIGSDAEVPKVELRLHECYTAAPKRK